MTVALSASLVLSAALAAPAGGAVSTAPASAASAPAAARPALPPASSASAVQTQPRLTPRQRQLAPPDRVPVDLTAVAADLAAVLRVPRQRVPDVVWLPVSVAAGACAVPPSRLPTGRPRDGERPAPACAAKQVTRGLADTVQGELASERAEPASR